MGIRASLFSGLLRKAFPRIERGLLTAPLTLPLSYFGMHAEQPNLNVLTYGIYRQHDSYTNWSILEPTEGTYTGWVLARLDAHVANCVAKGRDFVYTFVTTPTWASNSPGAADQAGPGGNHAPANFGKLTNFVNFILNRYKTQIQAGLKFYAEGWNEPNTPGWYNDTMANLVLHQQTIWNAVQAFNTTNGTAVKVISPSWTQRVGIDIGVSSLKAFINAGGNPYFDIIGFHPYMGDGYFLDVDRQVADLLKTYLASIGNTKDIWWTEVGRTDFYAATANEVARQLLYAAAMGIKRFIWYVEDLKGVPEDAVLPDMRVSRNPAAWNQAVAMLANKTIDSVSLINDGRIRALINGVSVIL